jgi:hypothetical protein
MYSTGSKIHYFSQELAMNADIKPSVYVEAEEALGEASSLIG